MSTVVALALALALGALPLLIYTLILWWFDRYEREPWPLLAAAFLWGALPAAFLSVVVGLLLDVPLAWLLASDGLAYPLVSSSVAAPLVEEAMKALGLGLLFLMFRDEIDSLFDGLLYGAVIGFGFGAVENALYLVVSENVTALLSLAGVRSVLFGLNHAMYTSFIGVAFAAAYLSRRTWLRLMLPLAGYGMAALAHASHNAGLTMVEVSPLGLGFTLAADALGVAFLFALVLVTRLREGRIVARYLAGEIEQGNLNATEVARVSAVFGRELARIKRLLSGDLDGWRRLGRFQHACAELAFAKRRMAEDGDLPEAVMNLRAQVAALRDGADSA